MENDAQALQTGAPQTFLTAAKVLGPVERDDDAGKDQARDCHDERSDGSEAEPFGTDIGGNACDIKYIYINVLYDLYFQMRYIFLFLPATMANTPFQKVVMENVDEIHSVGKPYFSLC